MNAYEFNPDWTLPPGHILAEFTVDQGGTITDMPRRLGVTQDWWNRFITGEIPLDADLAARIAAATSTDAGLWVQLERGYREDLSVGRRSWPPSATTKATAP